MLAEKIEWQPDLFDSPEVAEIRAKCANMQATLDKVRKKTFASHNVANSRIEDLDRRLQIIERALCACSCVS